MTFSVLCWCCSAGAKQFPEDTCHCEGFGAECCYQSPHPGSKRLRRPAFPAVEGCKPGWLGSKNGVEKLVTQVTKKFKRRKRMNKATCCEDISLRLRRRKGESASAWATRRYKRYQRLREKLKRVQGVTGPGVTTEKSYGRPWSWTMGWSTQAEEKDMEEELINSSDDDLAAQKREQGTAAGQIHLHQKGQGDADRR